MSNLIVVRGAGDIATGVLLLLHRSGFKVVALETEKPTAIRRTVAFSEAVYDGETTVEGVTARRISNISELKYSDIPILIDPDCTTLKGLQPAAVIDAVIAKRNLGTRIDMAPFTCALGPGFTAGIDVHAVIETMRGHDLGRVIYKGAAIANTGVPGEIDGHSSRRVIHAPRAGILHIIRDIGSQVEEGETIARIDGVVVAATLTGLLRGMLRDGFELQKGMKMADIDPRRDEQVNCHTVSDKARCIAAGVLLALMEAGVRP